MVNNSCANNQYNYFKKKYYLITYNKIFKRIETEAEPSNSQNALKFDKTGTTSKATKLNKVNELNLRCLKPFVASKKRLVWVDGKYFYERIVEKSKKVKLSKSKNVTQHSKMLVLK